MPHTRHWPAATQDRIVERFQQSWAQQRPSTLLLTSPQGLILRFTGAYGDLDRFGGDMGVLRRGRQLGMPSST